MSVAFLPAVVFLAAVLVVAEIVWLREGSEEKARSLMDGKAGPRLAPRPHPAAFERLRVVASKKSA